MVKVITAIQMLFMLFFMACKPIYFFKISQKISKCNMENNNINSDSDIFHQVRIKLRYASEITFVNKTDTIYVVESSDFQSGEIFGQIWSSKSEINYIYRFNNFYFQKDNVFDTYILELIKKWDLNELRKGSQEHSNMTPVYIINASRVIYANHKIKVDCISFKDFYNSAKR